MKPWFAHSKLRRAYYWLSATSLLILFTGCGDRPLAVGVTNWKPQTTGGPIETRPLPPAQQVYSNFDQWLQSETEPKVRLYELVLMEATNQSNHTVNFQKGDTPAGATDTTFVKFIYQDATNGAYQLEWHMRGRQQPDFLKANGHPRKFWLQPFGTPGESVYPRLQILAIEGVESRDVLVAEPGRKSLPSKK